MGKTRYTVASTERVKSTPTQTCTTVPDHSPASIVGRLPAHPARLHVGIVRAARPRRHAARPHDRPARRPGHDSLWRGHALAHALTPRCDASTREHTCHSAAFHRIQCPGRCLRMSTAPNNTSIQPRLNWLGIITAGTRWTTTSKPKTKKKKTPRPAGRARNGQTDLGKNTNKLRSELFRTIRSAGGGGRTCRTAQCT